MKMGWKQSIMDDDSTLIETFKIMKKMRKEEVENKTKVSSNYDWDRFSEDEFTESEEELVLDDDRDELDSGLKFVVQECPTITNPRRPKKFYKHKRNSVLHNNRYPVAALAKLALARYNAIQGKNYKYIGLVKAYKAVADGFLYWIRFKAYLSAQTPINFQAILFKGISHRSTSNRNRPLVDVNVKFVYPLLASTIHLR